MRAHLMMTSAEHDSVGLFPYHSSLAKCLVFATTCSLKSELSAGFFLKCLSTFGLHRQTDPALAKN